MSREENYKKAIIAGGEYDFTPKGVSYDSVTLAWSGSLGDAKLELFSITQDVVSRIADSAEITKDTIDSNGFPLERFVMPGRLDSLRVKVSVPVGGKRPDLQMAVI